MATLPERFDEARSLFLHNWERGRKQQSQLLDTHLNEIGEIVEESKKKAGEAEKVLEERKALTDHLAETTLALDQARARITEVEAANIELQKVAGVREHFEREIAEKEAELTTLRERLVVDSK